MSSVKSFFKKNKKVAPNVKVQTSSFDEPVEIRVVGTREYDTIQERCVKFKVGKGGKQERVFDTTRFNRELCTASIVVPDLLDASLQEDYEVRGAEDLYSAMFNWTDHLKILEAVTEAAGLEDFETKVDEAKN